MIRNGATKTLVEQWPVIYLIAGPLWAIGIAIWVVLPMAHLSADKIKECTSVTSGTVIAYDPNYHSSGVLQYTATGVTYTGAKLSGMSAADIGKKVTIHYAPKNPTLFYAGEEAHFSWTGWLFGMVALVVGVFVIMVCAYFNAMRKMKREPISRGGS